MNKLRHLFIALFLCSVCACHTAYNTGGHTWVKVKTIPLASVTHSKTTLEAKPVKTPTRPLPVQQSDNTLSASVDNNTPAMVTDNSTIPMHNTHTQVYSSTKNVKHSHTSKVKKSTQMAPFGEPMCSQRTAFYLSLPPFGLFGFHRFYLGYTLIGILQILTVGGLGLWTLVDIIRIYKGDLAAKDHYIYRRTWYN